MAAKVFSQKSQRKNIEIGRFLDKLGLNLTDNFDKTEWVEFSLEQAKKIRDLIDSIVKSIDEGDEKGGYVHGHYRI